MFDDDPDREPVDIARIFTDVEFLVCYVLPIVLLGAAFAILKEKDGQLRRKDWIGCSLLVFGMSAASAMITFFVEYALLKPLLGFELNLPRHMWWSIWLGAGSIFAALREQHYARLGFRAVRNAQAAVERLKAKQAAEPKKGE